MPHRPDQPSSPPPEFLTVDEAAALLRLNRNTLYEAIHKGRMTGVVRVGKRIRIRRAALLPALTPEDGGDLLARGNGSDALTER
jgi:excisionase family DNA binding protein